jgi:hypothetical protein
MACGACEQSGRTCNGQCTTHPAGAAHQHSAKPTSFGRFSSVFTAPGVRGGLALVRPAGDAEPNDESADDATAKNAAANANDNAARGFALGQQVLGTTSDAIGREQQRAARERELQSREEIARINAQRDRDLARIRADAETQIARNQVPPALDGPRPQLAVLGLDNAPNSTAQNTTPQNVNARPTAQASGGVLDWIKEHPLETAIGATATVIVIGGVAYYVMKSSKKRRKS